MKVSKLLLKSLYVAVVPVEVAVRPREVRHVERVHRRNAVAVRGDVVPAVGLVSGDLAIVPHVVEPLLRMHVGLRRRPRRGVDRGA